jgi:hypothetical protein
MQYNYSQASNSFMRPVPLLEVDQSDPDLQLRLPKSARDPPSGQPLFNPNASARFRKILSPPKYDREVVNVVEKLRKKIAKKF